jgi:hypothetical protein
MAEIRDLDVLRPERHLMRLAGHEIDVSFVPAGITFDVQSVVLKMSELDQKKLAKADNDELAKAFALGVELCAVFVARDHPDLTLEWFLKETNVEQVSALSDGIRKAYTHAYDGVDSDPN